MGVPKLVGEEFGHGGRVLPDLGGPAALFELENVLGLLPLFPVLSSAEENLAHRIAIVEEPRGIGSLADWYHMSDRFGRWRL